MSTLLTPDEIEMTHYDQAKLRADLTRDAVRAIWLDRIVFGVAFLCFLIAWWLA